MLAVAGRLRLGGERDMHTVWQVGGSRWDSVGGLSRTLPPEWSAGNDRLAGSNGVYQSGHHLLCENIFLRWLSPWFFP